MALGYLIKCYSRGTGTCSSKGYIKKSAIPTNVVLQLRPYPDARRAIFTFRGNGVTRSKLGTLGSDCRSGLWKNVVNERTSKTVEVCYNINGKIDCGSITLDKSKGADREGSFLFMAAYISGTGENRARQVTLEDFKD